MTDNLSESPHPSPLTPTQRSRFVLRAAQTRAPLLAAALTQYAADEGISWAELAQSLHCTSEQLDAVAMCLPPRSESFVADAAAIAEGYVDADRLLALLRRLQVLNIFRSTPLLQAADSSPQSVTLLAAQDREPLSKPELTESESD